MNTRFRIRLQSSITLGTLVALGIAGMFFLMGLYIFPVQAALLAALVNFTFVMSIFLTNAYYLFPTYYETGSRQRFMLLNGLMVLVLFSFSALFDHLYLEHQRLFVPHFSPPIVFKLVRAIPLLILTDFISISSLLMSELRKQERRQRQLKEEKLSKELDLLKAQINPHFIFNALNNIFSLSLSQSEKTPDSILKLSEMLRYVFYDCSHNTVSLKGEITYIQHFIAFQQMKTERPQRIVFHYEQANLAQQVAPMLFIPFIENAFKYSRIEEDTKGYVTIRLRSEAHAIHFFIDNSLPENGTPSPGQGLGIANSRQRLQVLYPQAHRLQINENTQHYSVELRIDL